MLLKNASVIIGDGRYLDRADLQLRGERIHRIARQLEPAQHEPVLDLAGHTILPGLMDAHVHLMFSGGPDPTAIQQYSDPLLTLIAA
ncbi:hypothetical protein GF339_11025, partial [candidate division KSB3 bacterium]|nr:hypothetical protein [candidate division KSB3 bacterium]MBD3325108.1 hypothetical protein [candidate division KSB3 bacterium]